MKGPRAGSLYPPAGRPLLSWLLPTAFCQLKRGAVYKSPDAAEIRSFQASAAPGSAG